MILRNASAGSTGSADVVIVGAGIAGLATAWQVAELLGTTTTIVLDPRRPLSLTSNRREANYRTWWPNAAMVGLARRSIELIDALRADGEPIAMDRRGYVYVTADAATAAAMPARVAEAPAGSGARALDAVELRERLPHLAPELKAGILVETAGGIDTVGLGEAIQRRAERHGVRVVRAEATGLERSSGGAGAVRGIRWAGVEGVGRIATERVVLAAGPFASHVGRQFGLDLPIETVLRQKVILHDTEGVVPRSAPFTIGVDPIGDRSGGVHIKPDDTAGADALKLGWAFNQEPSEPAEVPALPAEFPSDVLAAAAGVIPGLEVYVARGVVPGGHDGGFYARTPDGLPLIGELDVPGLFAVAGLAGFGAMMAAAAGELAAGLVLDRPVPPQAPGASAFDPTRFADAAYLEEIRSGRIATGEL